MYITFLETVLIQGCSTLGSLRIPVRQTYLSASRNLLATLKYEKLLFLKKRIVSKKSYLCFFSKQKVTKYS